MQVQQHAGDAEQERDDRRYRDTARGQGGAGGDERERRRLPALQAADETRGDVAGRKIRGAGHGRSSTEVVRAEVRAMRDSGLRLIIRKAVPSKPSKSGAFDAHSRAGLRRLVQYPMPYMKFPTRRIPISPHCLMTRPPRAS